MDASLQIVDQLSSAGVREHLVVSILVFLSGVFWLVTYVWVIRIGLKQQAVAVPMVAICLNLTWELLFGFIIPAMPQHQHLAMSALATWGIRLWFVLDLVVFYVLLRYGRIHVTHRAMNDHFFMIVLGMIVIAYFGQHTFTTFYQDQHGLVGAYISNFAMSSLFILMYFEHESRAAISHLVAWTKMLGTAAISLAHFGFMQPWNPGSPIRGPEAEHEYPEFMLFLFISVFILDCIYIGLTYPKRAANREPASNAAWRPRSAPAASQTG